MDFDRLAARHKDAVYRQMVRVCGNHEDAEDSLVEALLAAYKALPKLRDEAAFQGWLAIIGRRACSRIQRHEALRPVLSLSGLNDEQLQVPDTSTNVMDEAESRELTAAIKKTVSGLPDQLRQAYEMRDIQGLSNEETAKLLGINVVAVKSRVHRARLAVRKALDESVSTN